MRSALRVALGVLTVLMFATVSAAAGKTRVATYNIQFLNAGISKERADNLKAVIAKLDANVIGLQEIDDRAALERVFSKEEWQLVIDDESNDSQDLAVAVRKPLKVVNLKGDPANGLNAGDEDFLFPKAENNDPFPRRRDVLFVEVEIPQSGGKTFFVMVHHAKARVGGRNMTEQRRVAAARLMLSVLEARFDEKDFVLLGDFNDNGDDRSLNILETGDPNAAASMEETDGPFLINLCEPLLKENRVTHGRRESDVVGGKIDTVDLLSRKRNFEAIGTNTNTGDILFENMLVPMHMKNRIAGPARILDAPAGVAGGGTARASDHLPVYADFSFDEDTVDPDEPVTVAGVRIVALLPNPEGSDDGNEWIELTNGTTEEINFDGWRLRDRGANAFNLSGKLAAGATKRFMLPSGVMPLNNSGDDVTLINKSGQAVHQVSYLEAQAKVGIAVKFD